MWQVAQTPLVPTPANSSVGLAIPWFEWHFTHPGNPMVKNASLCGLFSKSCAKKTWHLPQTLATESTPGGVAPWLPWQVEQVGAEISPFCIAAAWTLVA